MSEPAHPIEQKVIDRARDIGRDADAARKMIAKCGSPQAALRRIDKLRRTQEAQALRAQRDSDLNRYADDARERHALRLEQDRAAREAQRAQMPLPRRLAQALAERAAISNVPAGAIEASVAGGNSKNNDGMQIDLGLSDLERKLIMIAVLVASIERDTDSLRGHVRPSADRETHAELSGRLEARLRSYRGLAPEDISWLDPEVGSASFIARERKRLGLVVANGNPDPKAGKA